ncbi:YmfQ family protein [Paenibacillus sp. HWE-109]|uniref:putative phage tail protein n=1 Tax=Paenibacillus sp. HWE-109 TaxID=1306526 RepID=UPI001EE1354B|nr:putative phage tail protein [Paenibacillus sp. HWE-109]UKS24310.1 YmfQ family protein [Paenibacillus sp. HWE-109]
MNNFGIVSPSGERMLDALPSLYEDIYEMRVLMETDGQEMDLMTSKIKEVLDQSTIDLATWGLDYWEYFLGIKTESGKPLDQRRSVIKSKIRGTGTVTLSLLKRVAEAYDNGQVEVTEDAANYKVIIKFVSTHGIPTNLADIEKALLDIMPAHLVIEFVFSYLSWGAFDTHGFTWESLSAMNYTWDQLERLA